MWMGSQFSILGNKCGIKHLTTLRFILYQSVSSVWLNCEYSWISNVALAGLESGDTHYFFGNKIHIRFVAFRGLSFLNFDLWIWLTKWNNLLFNFFLLFGIFFSATRQTKLPYQQTFVIQSFKFSAI